MTLDDGTDARWALSVVITDEFLNTFAVNGIGEGVEVAEFVQTFHVPMLGAVELAVGMSIVGVEFRMRAGDEDRLHATVSAAGHVRILGEVPMDLPGPARVRGEVLVPPIVRLDPDGTFTAVLDLPSSELVAMHFDGVDGLEGDAAAQAQMGEMLFATLGGELFAALAQQMGPVGLVLGPEQGRVLDELGVRPGPAELEVADGHLTVGLRAVPHLHGHAEVERVVGRRLRVGVAAGALSALVARLAEDTLGVPLPVELDVSARERRVGTSVRNPRLVDSPLVPDLRLDLRTTIRPRLVGDEVEFSLREAWVELPLVPDPVNRISRWFGGLAARAPLHVRMPARTTVPVRPDSDRRMDVSISGLDVGDDGVTLIVDAHL